MKTILVVLWLASSARADTSHTVVLAEAAGVVLPSKTCNTLEFRTLRARLHDHFQRGPRIVVDDSSVTLYLKPFAVATPSETRLLNGGRMDADRHVHYGAKHPGGWPSVVATFLATTAVFEFTLELPAAKQPDFAVAKVSLTDRSACVATWIGLAVITEENRNASR